MLQDHGFQRRQSKQEFSNIEMGRMVNMRCTNPEPPGPSRVIRAESTPSEGQMIAQIIGKCT
jgi:hypothetical protein